MGSWRRPLYIIFFVQQIVNLLSTIQSIPITVTGPMSMSKSMKPLLVGQGHPLGRPQSLIPRVNLSGAGTLPYWEAEYFLKHGLIPSRIKAASNRAEVSKLLLYLGLMNNSGHNHEYVQSLTPEEKDWLGRFFAGGGEMNNGIADYGMSKIQDVGNDDGVSGIDSDFDPEEDSKENVGTMFNRIRKKGVKADEIEIPSTGNGDDGQEDDFINSEEKRGVTFFATKLKPLKTKTTLRKTSSDPRGNYYTSEGRITPIDLLEAYLSGKSFFSFKGQKKGKNRSNFVGHASYLKHLVSRSGGGGGIGQSDQDGELDADGKPKKFQTQGWKKK